VLYTAISQRCNGVPSSVYSIDLNAADHPIHWFEVGMGGGIWGRATRRVHHEVRRVPAPDRIHRIVDREVHDRHAASGMDRGRLGARRLEDLEQRAVPLDDLIRLARITRSTGRPGPLERETGA